MNLGVEVIRELTVLNAGTQLRVVERSTTVRLYSREKENLSWNMVASMTRDEWELLIGTGRPKASS